MNNEVKISTKELLKLLGVGLLVIGAIAMPGLPKAYLLFKNRKKKSLYFNKRSLSQQIKRLKRQAFISIKEENGETIISLTDKGKSKILRYNFEEMQIKQPKKWDGKWRLVIFDIPEKYKVAREMFREKLKGLGFYRLQDSVFIYPFPCEKEIEFIRNYLEVASYVLILTFDRLEQEKLYLDKFNF